MDNQVKRNKGFSLIELLVAITLLSIIMIMVTQFMSTSTGAFSKTKRNLNLQNEAMEFGEQLSDTLAQATYIRIYCPDQYLYTIDNTVDPSKQNRKKREPANTGKHLDGCQLVCDNYPNYFNAGSTERKIILDPNTYSLVDESGTAYPNGADNGLRVKSFRYLTSDGADKPYYVIPRFLYICYKQKVNGVEEDAYAIYYFKPVDDNGVTKYSVYVQRDTIASLGVTAGGGEGYNVAVGKAYSRASQPEGRNGLISSNLTDFYFTADTEGESVTYDFMLQDPRYKQYTYNYVESVLFRNSNVLTVPPQKMYKKK